MTHSDDPMQVLRRFLTEDHADRILASVSDSGSASVAVSGADSVSGSVSAEDEGLAPMANLLAALQAPATPDELSGQEHLLAQMRAAMQPTSAPRVVSDASAAVDLAVDDAGLIDLLRVTPPPRRNTMLAKIVTGKVAALAAVGIFSVGAAAAATGTLPTPMQRSVSNAASHVGLDLPEPSRRLGDSSFRSSTSDDSSASSTSVSSPVSTAVSSTVSSTSTVTTLPSSASSVASAVNSRCDDSRERSDDGSSSTSTSAPTRVCSDDSTSTSSPSNTVTSIYDHGGDRDRSGSDDSSGSGSGSSGRSSGRNGSADDSTSTSGPSNTVTSIDDHGGDRDRTSSTTPSSSPATVTSIEDRGGNSGRGSGSSGSGSGSSGSGSNSGKG
ncbi:MAG: hypothetical protein AB7V43_11270 [Acidimicrobiia bacterium]